MKKKCEAYHGCDRDAVAHYLRSNLCEAHYRDAARAHDSKIPSGYDWASEMAERPVR